MKALSLLFAFTTFTAAAETDVLIYGATPGGIAAAISAAKHGKTVTLATPESEIGGLLTSGLSHTDFHSFESLTGTFLDFSQRVEKHYADTYGADSPQVTDSFHGTFGEPKVNLLILRRMLSEQKTITVRKNLRLSAATVRDNRVTSISVENPGAPTQEMTAEIFIDGTYEGDLMAAAGVPWTVGREGKADFGESLAPGEADGKLQAFNFRLIMTQDPENRVPATKPEGYDRSHFEGLLPILEAGKIDKVFGYPPVKSIFKAQTPPLPNGKYDINDVSRGIVRLSLPGQNLAWPDGDEAARKEVFNTHIRDQIGLIYFLQNDEAVPEKYRTEANEWGFAKDEFIDTNHIPRELYVREARRMKGAHIYTQLDSEKAPGDVRAKFFPDSIAMGDYGNNCHGTGREGTRWNGHHTGELYNPVPPYQIPYGTILPEKLENLLVPVAVSSTHVGFCALRLEPIWMSLGQAAGHAAAVALEKGTTVQEVPLPKLRDQLHLDNSATIYVSDVLPGHKDFIAVQWWGSQGGLHGLVADKKDIAPRGNGIHGQYSQAAPAHAVKLDDPIDETLRAQWLALAKKISSSEEKLKVAATAKTRGEFIKAIAP